MNVRLIFLLMAISCPNWAYAKCRWDTPPIYCAQITIQKFADSDPKYFGKDCVITAKLIKFRRLYHNWVPELMQVGQEIEISAIPSQCSEYKSQIGKTIKRGIVSVCRDVAIGNKIGGPEYDFIKDNEKCSSEKF